MGDYLTVSVRGCASACSASSEASSNAVIVAGSLGRTFSFSQLQQDGRRAAIDAQWSCSRARSRLIVLQVEQDDELSFW